MIKDIKLASKFININENTPSNWFLTYIPTINIEDPGSRFDSENEIMIISTYCLTKMTNVFFVEYRTQETYESEKLVLIKMAKYKHDQDKKEKRWRLNEKGKLNKISSLKRELILK